MIKLLIFWQFRGWKRRFGLSGTKIFPENFPEKIAFLPGPFSFLSGPGPGPIEALSREGPL